MDFNVDFDRELIKKYNLTGPRYTSYPTAVVFNESFSESDYMENLKSYYSASQNKPLSLYFHIPFCDKLCFFYACNKIPTKKRSKADTYLDHLELEIKKIANLIPSSRVVEQMHFGGGTPTFLTQAQMLRMHKMIANNFNLTDSNQRDYSIEIDPREANPAMIQLLKDIGFNRYSMGVQDVQEKVQKAVNRIQPIEMTRQVIDQCRSFNCKSINIDLIYGLPFQSLESFSDTLDQIIAISPDRLSVFNYAHLPHLFKPQLRINEADLPQADEKLDILKMTIEKLQNAGYVYIGMDHFAKPEDELALAQKNGSLQRNFQGYTTHAECDLIALGLSAISLVNNTFSQNSKTLENYYHNIELNSLAVWRGYKLNQDDQIRKQIIQDLSCHFSLDILKIEQQFKIDFDTYFKQENQDLAQFSDDGLVKLDRQNLTVTAKGRLLIRNICMVFDFHIRNQKNQAFSKVI
ncbi:MAG: oxygen-independent coproporphyrinogen III oxidase [Proteobacteria bacterium]|nr:oxygen-independent coproporphyrinogen III oxidase [Pseudomonadota bacterium]